MKVAFSLLALIPFILAAPARIPSAELARNVAKGLRLLSLEEGAAPVWKTEEEKLEIIKSGKGFFDITETYEADVANGVLNGGTTWGATLLATYPAPSKQAAVNPLLAKLSTSSMSSYLSQLTALNNRYYRSSTGAQASDLVVSILQTIAGTKSGITVTKFTHSFTMPSVIARIAGPNPSGPVTILGAHLDSVNGASTSGRAPGADDDGSGVVNLIEAFRVLVENDFKPGSTSGGLEFMFYAGEEGGLLGSAAIASNYKTAGKQVKAALQLDMTAYVKPGTTEVIALMTDYTDSGLNTFVTQLITTYSRLPARTSQCGYGCSDHASWNRQGYPSSFPFEGLFANSNPNIHGSGDTTSVTGWSWSHSLEFAKIALAFAYELASV